MRILGKKPTNDSTSDKEMVKMDSYTNIGNKSKTHGVKKMDIVLYDNIYMHMYITKYQGISGYLLCIHLPPKKKHYHGIHSLHTVSKATMEKSFVTIL